MFQAVGFKLVGDYLDLSYSDPSGWTHGLEDVESPNQFIALGDPDSGPALMFSAMPQFPQDLWFDSHYHGSDQFRVILNGEFLLQKHRMKEGDFGYQESGRNYREGVTGSPENCWLFNMHGTWRGARATRTRHDGTFDVPDLAPNQLDRWADTLDDPCWWNVPGGSKGIAAQKTSIGPNRAGYVWASFNAPEGWRALDDDLDYTSGMFGLPETGPILYTLKAGPDRVVVPTSVSGTEIACIVVGGSIDVDGRTYKKGDVRIQRAGVALGSIRSGAEGVALIYVIADRRHLPVLSGDDALSSRWSALLADTVNELAPDVRELVLEDS